MSDLVRDMFAHIDRMDTAGLLSHLAPDVVFQFGSAEAVTGRERVGEVVRGVFGGLRSISHDFQDIWQFDDVAVCRAATTYGLPDGRSMTLPAAIILKRGTDGLVTDYRIYQDVSPLWAPP